MAASKPSPRYTTVEPCSSSSSRGPSPASGLKTTAKKLPSLKNLSSNSSSRRNPSDLTVDNSSRVLLKNHPPTFGTIVKKFMEKRSNSKAGSARRMELAIPADAIAEDLKKAAGKASGGGFSSLHLKLFNRSGSADRTPRKALMEVNNNTRTLGMVLRSERELMSQNKEYEEVIAELRLLVEEKNLEVDKLKDLCLKQREEIKALKDAILFPDVINSQLHGLFERQGSELKEARKIIPCLQKQVSSLTGKIQCLAEDLAEDIPFAGPPNNSLQKPNHHSFFEIDHIFTSEEDQLGDNKFLIRWKDKPPTEDNWMTMEDLQKLTLDLAEEYLDFNFSEKSFSGLRGNDVAPRDGPITRSKSFKGPNTKVKAHSKPWRY